MNKKLIRLTESDLHRIVKESVNKVLSEAINELDPRTYASYADKRAKQANVEKYLGNDDKADSLYKKAHQGKQAAVKAFNNQYGYDKEYPIDGQYRKGLNTARYEMDLGSGDKNYPYRANTYYAETDPKYAHGQTINFGKGGNDVVNHRRGSYGDNYEEYKNNDIYHPYDSIGRKQTKVAQQMAQGNGKYIKGQGWQ